MGTQIEFVDDARTAGSLVAKRVAETIGERSGRPFVLGLPAGRTPRTTIDALAELAGAGMNMSGVEIVMMDEFVERDGDVLRALDPDAPHSCRRFGEVEVRRRLNAAAVEGRGIPAGALHTPDPADPGAYDALIEGLGGVDLFVLASGASDGHVGFNMPGTALSSRTRVVALSHVLRRDNLSTFPSLRTLEHVPRYGVTVGLGTIVASSREIVLLLLGSDKETSARRVTRARGFDESWPATLVHECPAATVIVDRAAAGTGEGG